jgi:hypothetical protein
MDTERTAQAAMGAEELVRGWSRAERGPIQLAGFAMLFGGILVLIVAVTSFLMGSPPADSPDYFIALETHLGAAWLTFGLYSMADLLMVVALPGLYLAFRRANRQALLAGLSVTAAYLVVDLGVTELNSLTLVRLAGHRAGTAGAAERAAIQDATTYALATPPAGTFFSYFVSSVGLLIVTLVMLRAGFGRWLSLLGIVAYCEGIAGSFYVWVPVLGLLLMPCLVAFGLWLILAGARLARLAAIGAAAANSLSPFPFPLEGSL